MAPMQTISILLYCDVEPDGRTVDPRSRCDWVGFEGIIELLPRLRACLEAATDRPAHLSWFVRMDPQVAHVYGSAGWAAARYRAEFETLSAAGDQIGLHVHPWQWHDDGNYWTQNFADQPWVSHCVESSLNAFEQNFGYPCEAFRFGDHWMNDATIDLLERRGVICELTVEPGLAGSTTLDVFAGAFPDYSNVPRLPYRPSPDHSLCMIPVSTGPGEWATTQRAHTPAGMSAEVSAAYSPNYEGRHDAATTEAIAGWVWDRNHPERRLDVDVLCGDELLATVGATGFRPDLEAAGKGDGRYAFWLATPKRLADGRKHQIRVRVSGTEIDLVDTPRAVVAGHGFGVTTLHLDLAPMRFAPTVDRLLASLSPPFLSMPVRSDAGGDPQRRANIVRNIDHLLSNRLADRFTFITPSEFVRSWPDLAKAWPAISLAT